MPPHRLFGARHQVPRIPPVPKDPPGADFQTCRDRAAPSESAKKKGRELPPGSSRPWHPYRAPDQPLFSLVNAPRRWPRQVPFCLSRKRANPGRLRTWGRRRGIIAAPGHGHFQEKSDAQL